jgi:hypothetical protein
MSVHTDSEAHSASYSIGIVGRLQMIERPMRESDHSTQSNVQVNNEWCCHPFTIFGFIMCTWTYLCLPLSLVSLRGTLFDKTCIRRNCGFRLRPQPLYVQGKCPRYSQRRKWTACRRATAVSPVGSQKAKHHWLLTEEVIYFQVELCWCKNLLGINKDNWN